MITDLWARLWSRSPAAPAVSVKSAKTPPVESVESVESAKIPERYTNSAQADLRSALTPASRRSAILATAINPALGWLSLRGVTSDDRARVLMLAIAGQESDAQYRRQHGNGPARGLWQFESGGGVRGVLMHRSSARLAAALCEWRGVKAETPIVHAALERDDVLAAGFARLLLFTDPAALPSVEAEDAGWAYYLRNWRPGKPHPERWPANWKMAREAVEG